ncbi:hypothetical protein DPEC_G00313050 [Dallia pectoralis]|uniref:Uncharacterized protein n=1 Tax=Dallia pectoralis TaxID=75939 RepID=A0ACC2FBS4_DALPE|nr:hypothetical protein DPEC_G00313050 [Dallia pectoralis]
MCPEIKDTRPLHNQLLLKGRAACGQTLERVQENGHGSLQFCVNRINVTVKQRMTWKQLQMCAELLHGPVWLHPAVVHSVTSRVEAEHWARPGA